MKGFSSRDLFIFSEDHVPSGWKWDGSTVGVSFETLFFAYMVIMHV